jgi:hypothetical protein
LSAVRPAKQRVLARIVVEDRAHLALDLFHFGPQRGMPPLRALAQGWRFQPLAPTAGAIGEHPSRVEWKPDLRAH